MSNAINWIDRGATGTMTIGDWTVRLNVRSDGGWDAAINLDKEFRYSGPRAELHWDVGSKDEAEAMARRVVAALEAGMKVASDDTA